MHAQRQSASGLNAYTLKIPIPSAFNILEGRSRLRDYPDTKLCDFLQFGWPVGFTAPHLPLSSCQNHGSALSSPQIIDSFLDTECHLGTTCGPFKSNPFYTDMVIGPLQITHSRSGKPCIVLYLSFPKALLSTVVFLQTPTLISPSPYGYLASTLPSTSSVLKGLGATFSRRT